MLTGMVPVTEGVAFVSGRNVNGDMVDIRRNLGVCPQHDVLYPDLTVREHLRMYAVLKGVPRKEVASVIQVKIEKRKTDRGFMRAIEENTKKSTGPIVKDTGCKRERAGMTAFKGPMKREEKERNSLGKCGFGGQSYKMAKASNEFGK